MFPVKVAREQKESCRSLNQFFPPSMPITFLLLGKVNEAETHYFHLCMDSDFILDLPIRTVLCTYQECFTNIIGTDDESH